MLPSSPWILAGCTSEGPSVEIYDTTLRDGTQREGISLSCEDKIRIARRLDAIGVSYIEGGWPGSNPKDAEFFRRALDEPWKTSTIAAFGATRRAGIRPEDDPSVMALIESGASVCTIFGKSSTLHVTEVLRTSLDENLSMIDETVSFLRNHGMKVIYDAEHFFDGYALDASYAMETLRAALRGGAEAVVLCDTNGGSVPWTIERVVRKVGSHLSCVIGIHAHDDSACAVANSIMAVNAGARHVQGTINGYGERCGNANLCAVIPDLEVKLGFQCLPPNNLSRLYELSHYVAEVANLAPDEHMPYVGRCAFAHKAGVHVAAMRRSSTSYQHVDPDLVGNQSRVVVSELSGRANVLAKAEDLGLDISQQMAKDVLEDVKDGESKGYSYEAAEASFALMLHRRSADYEPPFRLVDFKVLVGHRQDLEAYAEAMVKVLVGTRVTHTAAEGCGPVSALDTALRKALVPDHPAVRKIQLVDYKVRILEGRDGTAAITRVLIDSTDGVHSWSTIGASSNIIEASCRALVDSIEYGLLFVDQSAKQVPLEMVAS